MMLLVGLFFVLAVLVVLGIWLWQELESEKQGQRPQSQPPKIVIRPKLFRTKRIVVQQAVTPTALPHPPRPTPPPPPRSTQPPVATPPRATPAPAATPPRATPPPTTAPPVSRTPPPPASPRVTPPPPPSPPPAATAQRKAPQPLPEPVAAVGNGPVIGNTRVKVDFDTFCRPTGRSVRTCSCRRCREMRADAGI